MNIQVVIKTEMQMVRVSEPTIWIADDGAIRYANPGDIIPVPYARVAGLERITEDQKTD